MSNASWEEIISHIDELVVNAVESSTFDLATVIKLHDKLVEISEMVENSEYPGIQKISQKTADFAMSIVLQEAKDPEKALDLVVESTSCLQCMVREILRGGSPSYIPIPDGLGLKSEELFTKKEDVPVPERKAVVSSANQPMLPEFEMGSLTSSHLADFLSEFQELVQRAEGILLSLEKSQQQDPQNIQELFGVFHTIKGISGIIKLQKIIELSHKAEIILEKVSSISPDSSHTLFECIDVFKAYARSLQHYHETKEFFEVPDSQALMAKLESMRVFAESSVKTANILPHTAKPAATVKPTNKPADLPANLHSNTFSKESDTPKPQKTVEPVLSAAMQDVEKIVTRVPALTPPQPMPFIKKASELVPAINQSDAILEEKNIELVQQSTSNIPLIQQEVNYSVETKTISNVPQNFDSTENQTHEPILEINTSDVSANTTQVHDIIPEPTHHPAEIHEVIKVSDVPKVSIPNDIPNTNLDAIKITTQRLDMLMDAVGELVIAQSILENDSEVAQIHSPETIRNFATIRKITRELQKLSMSMRMVTIQPTFQAMERLVRDLAHNQGKLVEVDVSGENTELDRNIVDAIYNPLIHLVRNAVGHGIELPYLRKEKGKNAKGRINFNAYHRGGNIVIEIQDDGQGLQREKILQKAIQQGFIDNTQDCSDEMIYQMIFLPGFSTAETIGEVSGRGVGLDVVKKNVEKLRGRVEISTHPGQGTIFRLTLPLTLAIIEGMLVKLGERRYIIPLIHIEEFVQITTSQLSNVMQEGKLLLLRGSTLPVLDLESLLQRDIVSREKSVGVIVSDEGKRYCFLVDELLGQQQVVIKSLGNDFQKLVGISGSAILGDGRVGLILDVQDLLHHGMLKAV